MTRKLVGMVVVALALVSACGDDDSGGATGGPAPAAAAAAAASGSASALIPRVHIEDRVPDAEKPSIRHTFKERDFAAETNRDPFQSFVVILPGTPQAPLETNGSQQPGAVCTRADQFVATGYSYADLKLVGIVAQGTQRKVLMMDTINHGHSIKRGDCVGKEKAVVKDIGTGYITFVVMPDSVPNGSQRPPEEHSVQLHPTDLEPGDYSTPNDEPRPGASVAPVMPPTAPTGPTKVLQMPAPVPTPAGIPVTSPPPSTPAPAGTAPAGTPAPPPLPAPVAPPPADSRPVKT